MVHPNQIVVTGHWDGVPIWRPKTSAELLAEEIIKNENKIKTWRLQHQS